MRRAQPLNDDSVAVRMPAELRARASEIAAASGRTFAGHIRWLLLQDVAAHDAAELEIARRGGGLLDPLPSKSNGPGVNGADANTTTEAAVDDGRRT